MGCHPGGQQPHAGGPWPLLGGRARGSCAEPVDQQSVTEAPVAHRERLLSQLLHDRPDDARAREDDVRALGLQTDNRATSLRVAWPVELDLAIDLGAVQDRALDDV